MTEVNQLQKLGKLVETGDRLRKSKEWKKALEVYRSGLRLATKLKHTEYRGIFLRKIAAIQINQGIINNAMVNLEKALALFHSIESKRNLAITYLDIGAAYLERGDHIKALEYLDKAQTLATSINDNICLAAILNNRGLALIYEAKFEESKSILSESLRLYKELGLKGDEGYPETNIGLAYLYQGSLEKAYDHITRAWDLAVQYSDPHLELVSLVHRIQLALEMDDHYVARHLFTEAVNLATQLEEWAFLAQIYILLAWTHTDNRDYQSAFLSLDQARTLARRFKLYVVLADQTLERSRVYLRLSDRDGFLKQIRMAIRQYNKLHHRLGTVKVRALLNQENIPLHDELIKIGVR